jgi:hypothetical protein
VPVKSQAARHFGLGAPDVSCDLCLRFPFWGSRTHRAHKFAASSIDGLIAPTSSSREL